MAGHGAWCSIAERRALRLLVRASKSDGEASELVEGFDLLRRCGDMRSLRDAIGHLLRVGSANALARTLRRLPRTGWSRIAIAANLDTLMLGGDFLEEEAAGELLLSCSRFAVGDTGDPEDELASWD